MDPVGQEFRQGIAGMSLICSVCWFPRCNYSYPGQHQATRVTSLNVDLGKNANNLLLWASTNWLQHFSVSAPQCLSWEDSVSGGWNHPEAPSLTGLGVDPGYQQGSKSQLESIHQSTCASPFCVPWASSQYGSLIGISSRFQKWMSQWARQKYCFLWPRFHCILLVTGESVRPAQTQGSGSYLGGMLNILQTCFKIPTLAFHCSFITWMFLSTIVKHPSFLFFNLLIPLLSVSPSYSSTVEERGSFDLQSFPQPKFYWLNSHMQLDVFHSACKLAGALRGLFRLRFDPDGKATWVLLLLSSWGTSMSTCLSFCDVSSCSYSISGSLHS